MNCHLNSTMICYIDIAHVDIITLSLVQREVTYPPNSPPNIHEVVNLELQAHTQKLLTDHVSKLAPKSYSSYISMHLSYILYYRIKVVQGWEGGTHA